MEHTLFYIVYCCHTSIFSTIHSFTNGVSSGTTRYNVKMAKKKGDEKVNQTPQSDNEEQNFDEEPDFDDPEGFVDDIPDEGG